MGNKQLVDFLTAENALDGTEPVYIAQDGKTRKTFLQKIKDFIIGTTTMGTTATDVTGAVAELKESVDLNTTQLNDIENNKIDTTKVVNNCSVTEEGFVLDARQGKVIMDTLNSFLSLQIRNNINIDEINDNNIMVFKIGTENVNGTFPDIGGEKDHSILINLFGIAQFLITTNNVAYSGNKFFHRSRLSSNDNWTNWVQ